MTDQPARPRAWRTARHYAPVVVAAVVFVLVVTLTPTVAPTTAPAGGGGSPGGNPLSALPLRYQPGQPGVAVSGVRCGPAVRQVSWSHYSPICQPTWHGGNGGATSPGVTGSTITITFRYAATAAEVKLASTFAPQTLGTQAEAIAAMQAYVKVLNRQFEELYGRQVKLVPFTGKGDVLIESQGGDLPQAQADVATAKSLGAFADVSTLFETVPYVNALHDDHIVAIGGMFESQSEMAALAPYQFSPSTDCTKTAEGAAAIVGHGMAHLSAIYAGDAGDHAKPRVFGLISPDNPIYESCTNEITQILQQDYHQKFAVNIHYALNLLTGSASEFTQSIAQLKAAGVTTVVCGCDPLSPIFLSEDANQQGYHPEWLTLGFGDAFARLVSTLEPGQWDHAITGGAADLPQKQEESYIAYRMAQPTGPIIPSYETLYQSLLLLFDGLQAAGPDLTPSTFEHGLWSLPASVPGGEFGNWTFGPDTYDPPASFQILWWDPTGISPQDGLQGAWEPCNHGQLYTAASNTAFPVGQQLQCFQNAPPAPP